MCIIYSVEASFLSIMNMFVLIPFQFSSLQISLKNYANTEDDDKVNFSVNFLNVVRLSENHLNDRHNLGKYEISPNRILFKNDKSIFFFHSRSLYK